MNYLTFMWAKTAFEIKIQDNFLDKGGEMDMTKKTFNVLSIDGGGIRGIIPAKWLEQLENDLGQSLHEYFDLIVGSSTGAILAAGLATDIAAKDIVEFYKTDGIEIFPNLKREKLHVTLQTGINKLLRPKYKEEPLAKVLKKRFKDTILKDVKTPCMITAYDVQGMRLRQFSSWNPKYANIPLWEACKASCSAPTYFPAHVLHLNGIDIPLIDGGVAANNPSSLALALAVQLSSESDLVSFENETSILLVSMGTGNITKPITIPEATKWGGIGWAFPILDVVRSYALTTKMQYEL